MDEALIVIQKPIELVHVRAALGVVLGHYYFSMIFIYNTKPPIFHQEQIFPSSYGCSYFVGWESPSHSCVFI